MSISCCCRHTQGKVANHRQTERWTNVDRRLPHTPQAITPTFMSLKRNTIAMLYFSALSLLALVTPANAAPICFGPEPGCVCAGPKIANLCLLTWVAIFIILGLVIGIPICCCCGLCAACGYAGRFGNQPVYAQAPLLAERQAPSRICSEGKF